MKIQPIDVDSQTLKDPIIRPESTKPLLKSRLKRLFDRPFPSVLRISSAERQLTADVEPQNNKDAGTGPEFEPSSVCLDKMVQNFIEEFNEKQSNAKCCNCFNGNVNDSSDDELDAFRGFADSINGGSFSDCTEILKSLIPCPSAAERNLLADTAVIIEKNGKNHKRKDDLRKLVTVGLSSLGYDCSICKSKWDKCPFPAGEYEYIDVIVNGERLLVDIDFRSEFEIARSTGAYNAVLQTLPYIFVGKPERIGQIVSIVSEAAKLSLKKKGMHFPPWRKAEYMRAKWLSSYIRATEDGAVSKTKDETEKEKHRPLFPAKSDDCGELELIFGEKTPTPPSETLSLPAKDSTELMKTWKPPTVKPKTVEKRTKMVTELASLLKEKP